MMHKFNPETIFNLIQCESSFNPTSVGVNKDKDGKIKSYDYGLMQINSSHLPEAKSFGLDVVNNVTDNLQYGFYLLENSGLTPWKSSKKCREKLSNDSNTYSDALYWDGKT